MRRVARGLCLSALVGASLAGCGLETAVVEAFSDEHEIPVTIVRGTVSNAPEAMTLERPDGEVVEPIAFEVDGATYQLDLPDAVYTNARLVASAADGSMVALVPSIAEDSVLDGVDIDARSTAAALIVDTALELSGTSLQVVDSCVLGKALESLDASMGADGAAATVLDAVESANGLPEAGADLDAARAEAAGTFSLDGVLDEDNIRVVLEVDYNDGRLDGNCDGINRFRWVTDASADGKQMYFVGGFHEESPVQDPELAATMGDTGSWTPNTVPMFDDGTNGDEVAGDNIWTVTYVLPRGARIGYKYTWGNRGQLWTGTEEWPGNQRILEIVDVNGDNFVRRRDNFADEATNKDLANLNRSGMGSIDWESDVNGDEIADARERPLDLDYDCMLDDWVTPTAIGPATVACE